MIDLYDRCCSHRLVPSTLWYRQTSILRVAYSRPIIENFQIDIHLGSRDYLLSNVREVICSNVSIPHFWPSQDLEIHPLLNHDLDSAIVGNIPRICLGCLQANQKRVGSAFTRYLLGCKNTVNYWSIHWRQVLQK